MYLFILLHVYIIIDIGKNTFPTSSTKDTDSKIIKSGIANGNINIDTNSVLKF